MRTARGKRSLSNALRVIAGMAIGCCFTNGADAQWLEHPFYSSGYERPKPRALRFLASAQPETPEWEFPNVNITQSPDWDQTEPAIAISPVDPSLILVGANDDRDARSLWSYISTDAGTHWNSSQLPVENLNDLATDPSIDFDRSGRAFFGSGRFEGSIGSPYSPNGVVCDSFANPGWTIRGDIYHNTKGDTLSDKYYIAVDRTEKTFSGRIYATWVDQGSDREFGNPDSLTRIVSAYSKDHGATWSYRSFVTPDQSFYNSPVPAVSAEGLLYIAFIDLKRKEILCSFSTDGGVTFSNPVVVSSYTELGPIVPAGDSRGYPVIKTDVGVNSFPAIAIDNAQSSSGIVYITWCGIGSDGLAHVFLAKSTSGVARFQVAQLPDVPNELGHDTFFPWIAVDQSNGAVGIDYYSSANDQTDQLVDLYLSISRDEGAHFTTRKISSAASDPRQTRDARFDGLVRFFGDYIGLAVTKGLWYPVWTDSRQGDDLEIYTARVDPSLPAPVEDLAARDTLLASGAGVSLSWDYNGLTTFGEPLSNYAFEISDKNGTVLGSTTLTSFTDSTLTGTGIYEVTVVANASRSVPRSIASKRSDVKDVVLPATSLEITQQSRVSGETALRVRSSDPVAVEVEVFDVLGRPLASLKSADMASEHLVIIPSFDIPTEFYIVRSFTSNGSVTIRTGKIAH